MGHCEPAKPAWQSIFLSRHGGKLDCFVAALLAMTTWAGRLFFKKVALALFFA